MTLTYAEALDYLYSLINYELKRPERYTPDVISLERPRKLMELLGDPQKTYPVIHVTGTKGKGSVSVTCASILQAAGLRVGLYSSPNLQDFRERFRLNGELIEKDQLVSLVERIRPLVAEVPGLTWFEVITAIAFLYFAESKVDIAVIEVGLGGRLDSTNIIENPLAAVITSLSYDHMYLLGNTLAEIAYEKAGIIKMNCPVVSAPQWDEALEVVERTATERNAPLTLVGRDYLYTVGSSDPNGQKFTAHRPDELPIEYWTPLIGEHQAINAAVALAAIHQVRNAGFKISDKAIDAGLRSVNWAGRLEVVRRSPYLVLDVAHNAESARRLKEALVNVFPAKQRIMIFGALNDKDVTGMYRELLPEIAHLILMHPVNSRAFGMDELEQMARASGYTGTIEKLTTARDSLVRAEALATPDDLICVTGSFAVVGEMRTVLGLSPARAHYLDESAVMMHMDKA